MTSRERLLATLRGHKTDRVPMPLRMWKFLRKYYPNVDPLQRVLQAHDEFGIDIWQYSSRAPLPCFEPTSTAWRDDVEVELSHHTCDDRDVFERTIHTPKGDLHDVKQVLKVKEGSGSGPEIVEPLIKDIKRDLPRFRYMHADPQRIDINSGLEIGKQIGDKGLVVANMYSPIDCRDAMKQEDFLMLYYDDRSAFRELVEIGANAMMSETRQFLESGFDVVNTWWFYASPSSGWSPSIYEDVFLPHLAAHVELVHSYGALYVYYDDGRMRQFADFYVDAGIDCLMTCCPPPMGDADPKELKDSFGHRVTLMGGIDVVNEVYLSNPEAIWHMVRERLRILKPGGRYIMDGSNSLVYETPIENVRALADAGREFGQYHNN